MGFKESATKMAFTIADSSHVRFFCFYPQKFIEEEDSLLAPLVFGVNRINDMEFNGKLAVN